METYRIIAQWEGRIGLDTTEFEMDFAEERSMQHYVERMAVVGVWDQDEVGRAVLIPATQIVRITVEVIDA